MPATVLPHESLMLFADDLLRLLRLEHACKAPLPAEVVTAASRLAKEVDTLRAERPVQMTSQALVEQMARRIRELEARLRQKPIRPRSWQEVDPLLKGNPAQCGRCKGSGVAYPGAANGSAGTSEKPWTPEEWKQEGFTPDYEPGSGPVSS